MVKKLIKHEMHAYVRILVPLWVVLIGIASLNRFVQLFETDNVVYDLLFWSSVLMLVVASIACLLLTIVSGVSRYYRNLFSDEGYLSFTLPVTPAQHIFVKLLVATLFSVFSFLVVLCGIGIATAGDVFVELYRAVAYLGEWLFRHAGVHGGLYIAEAIILFLLSTAESYLIFYTCITIGQTARKNRVLCAVGVYGIYYVIRQALGTIVTILLTVCSERIIEPVATFAMAHTLAFVHIVFGVLLADALLISILCYGISHYITCNRLNLE